MCSDIFGIYHCACAPKNQPSCQNIAWFTFCKVKTFSWPPQTWTGYFLFSPEKSLRMFLHGALIYRTMIPWILSMFKPFKKLLSNRNRSLGTIILHCILVFMQKFQRKMLIRSKVMLWLVKIYCYELFLFEEMKIFSCELIEEISAVCCCVVFNGVY